MMLRDWARSGCDYRRRLLNAGVCGARDSGKKFLRGKRLVPVLAESSANALGVAAAGACVGAVGGYLRNRQKSAMSVLVFGIIGCAVGFGLGAASRQLGLGANIASGACRAMGRVRDERWLEENPIDYA